MELRRLDLSENDDILIFTDLHAHEYKKFNSPTTKGYGTRLGWVLSTLKYIIDFSVKHRIKHVFFLGDLLHHRTLLYSIVFDKVAQCLEEGIQKGVEFHFILGNHDYIYNTNDSPSVLTRLNGIDIISEPTIFQLPASFGYNIGCIPFRFDIETQEKEIRELSDFCTVEDNVLLGHLELSGAQVNDEYVLSKCLRHELFSELKFKFIFTGHIHTRQIITVPRFNYPNSSAQIEYVGIPLQHTFNEEGKDYGFTVYNCMLRDPTYYKLSDLVTVPEFTTIDFYTQQDIELFLFDYKTKLDLNYFRFRGHDPELKLDTLFKRLKFYSYDCVGAKLATNQEEEVYTDYSFNLDFQHYLILYMQQQEQIQDLTWFDTDEAAVYLDEIYKRGNICLK